MANLMTNGKISAFLAFNYDRLFLIIEGHFVVHHLRKGDKGLVVVE